MNRHCSPRIAQLPDRSKHPAGGGPATRRAGLPAAALLVLLTGGCALPQPPAASPDTPTVTAPIAGPECAECAELRSDVRDLRTRVKRAESVLGELRARQLEQARTGAEANRQAARASARLRHLATRATAASYIAEVEVSMANARLASGSIAGPQVLQRAQQQLDSSREPFEQGDYASAIDLAGQAAETLAAAQRDRSAGRDPARGEAALPFEQSIPMRVRIDSNLRRGPSTRSAVRDVLAEGTPLMARAQHGDWLHVETVDGRTGWVYRTLLAPRQTDFTRATR